MAWWRIPIWFLIRAFGLRKWFASNEGPTEDDWRNPFWRYTESKAIKVDYSIQDIDFRFGYYIAERGRLRWIWFNNLPSRIWVPGNDANFYNGVFTFSRTLTKGWDRNGKRVLKSRFNIVIRLFHSWWFAFGVGTLPDRGEFGWTGPWFYSFKSQSKYNPDVIARDHEEGSV